MITIEKTIRLLHVYVIFESNNQIIVFCRVGGFETGRGIPEDLIFFYKHLDLGGKILRLDDCLLIYTYHFEQTTFSVQK